MLLKTFFLQMMLLFALGQSTCCATNYQEIFLKANDLYKEGKFDQALELYEKIPNKTSTVYYNQGNCAYKLGNSGRALVYWRRAERDWGFLNRTELLNNINLIKQQFKKNMSPQETPLDGVKTFIDTVKNNVMSLVRAIPLFNFQLIFLVMWVFSFLYLRYLYRHRQRAIIIFLFLANVICGTLLALKYNFEFHEHGVITAKQALLMSGPGKNYQQLGQLPEACEVVIQKYSDGFYKIKIGPLIGWVDGNTIEKY